MPDLVGIESSSSESTEEERDIQSEREQDRPRSRQVSPVETQYRQEQYVQPSRTLQPGENIMPGMVYKLPDIVVEEQVNEHTPRTEAVSKKVRKRAEKLGRLPPEQEYMRINIAKALTLKKKESKANGFLNKLLRK